VWVCFLFSEIDLEGLPGLKRASREEKHWTRRVRGTWDEVPASWRQFSISAVTIGETTIY
jgi:hypothetical protein